MKKILLYSVLLIVGLFLSQLLPIYAEAHHHSISTAAKVASMVCLSYIMIHVGFEFTIEKSKWRSYAWDYVVAMTAAAFPWIFCAVYFVYFVPQQPTGNDYNIWRESLITARFAAPTSAGVLFSMLAAAGLATTWLFKKARILAIFDDLDTIILIIPLKVMFIGFNGELVFVLIFIFFLLWAAWRYLKTVNLPYTWPWIFFYSLLITAFSELLYLMTKTHGNIPVQIEVLLPAFVLGCIMCHPFSEHTDTRSLEMDLFDKKEKKVLNIISAIFMLFVGLSMPSMFQTSHLQEFSQFNVGWKMITLHVLAITFLSNLGKMFPAFCYKKEASWKERLALAIGMFPRGEVGAGVIIISLSLGIKGPIVTIALFSLALNLIMTGLFICFVKLLLKSDGKEVKEA